ncbi:proton-coupled amino acid transporter-like protein pathetic isoform X2 [Hyposmocoma kahamanoa]|uniref:proton-coupled amino acid transporter-like protein pathetic isoform X2 n=1 Tax=Hyposmocoma kahamanoa TaxID=1477025 RepID=UPI000E6D7182|nr:proton-coupled amino acid transporter-like protein pathetic isoform X2 [Hyposmocoma kahamanoa]
MNPSKKENDRFSDSSSYLSKDSEEEFGIELDRLNQLYQNATSLDVYPGAEPMHYDFVAERHILYPTRIWESLAHLIKTCLGAGFLGIHEAYMYGGIWTSLVSSIFITIISTYNMLSLAKSAHIQYNRLRTPKLSYPDLVEVTVKYGPVRCFRKWSKAFRYAVDTCLFIELCSVCCVYHIMIASTLKQSLEVVSVYMADLALNIRIYILLVLLPILLISFIRSLKYLAPFSLVADAFIVLCAFTAIYYSIKQAKNINDVPGWKGFYGFFRFSGVFMYSIDGITIIMPIENIMERPLSIPFVIHVGMTIVVILTSFVGFFGYWGWREDCKTPITTNMPVETGTLILRFLIIIMFTATYAVHFWVPFRIAWRYLGRKIKRKRARCERLYRTALVTIICLVCIGLPNMNILMSFVGNFFIAFLTFIFPAFIDSMVTWDRNNPYHHLKLIKNFSIMAFGAVLTIGSLYSYLEFYLA